MVTYHEDDLWYFVNLGSTAGLATPKRAMSLLESQSALLVEMHGVLQRYPDEQIDGLDFWYRTFRGLGMLDPSSLHGMVTRCSWRGVVWGGWLALLSPEPELLPILKMVPELLHGNEWAVRSAIEEIEQHPLTGPHENLRRLVRKCRHYVKQMAIVRMPLRIRSTPTDRSAIEAFQARVRQAYVRRGADAALAIIRESPFRELLLDYPTWYRQQQGIEMRRDYIKRWSL